MTTLLTSKQAEPEDGKMSRWDLIGGSQELAKKRDNQTNRLVGPSGRSGDKPIIVATCM